jgi:hypothetical protein
VRKKAEEAIAGCADAELAALREAFVPGLVRVNEEGAYARRTAPRADLPAAALPLVKKLVDARLLVESQKDHIDRVEVAHEALFRVWPTLSGWLASERDFLIGKSRIEQLFKDYQALPKAQRVRGLLSGILLERARSWVKAAPGRFSKEEVEFIRRSGKRARTQRWMLIVTGIAILAA